MQTLLRSYYPAIIAVILWSTAFPAVKIGLEYAPPFMFAGLRFVLAGIILIPFAGGLGARYHSLRPYIAMVCILGCIQTFLQYFFFYAGIDRVAGATAAIITGSTPLIAAVAAHFFFQNDKLSLRKVLAIAGGIGGIVFLAMHGGTSESENATNLLGMALLLGGGITTVAGNMYLLKTKRPNNTIALNSGQLIWGGILLIILSLFTEDPQSIPTALPFWGSLAWLLMVTAVAYTLWYLTLVKPGIKVSDINVWKFIIPVSGACLSWVLLPEEGVHPAQIVGMILIAVAICVYYAPLPKKKSRNI